MHLLKKLLATSAIAFAGMANATVITFEDLNGNGAMASSYAGLTWGDGWKYFVNTQTPYAAASGKSRVYNFYAQTDWFKFGRDVVFDGAFFAGMYGAAFELYDNGKLVHTSSTLALSGTPTFLSSGYTGLIDEVRLLGSNGFFVMDDVTYRAVATAAADTTNAVPEPGSLALMGLGLAGLMAVRRRKR